MHRFGKSKSNLAPAPAAAPAPAQPASAAPVAALSPAAAVARAAVVASGSAGNLHETKAPARMDSARSAGSVKSRGSNRSGKSSNGSRGRAKGKHAGSPSGDLSDAESLSTAASDLSQGEDDGEGSPGETDDENVPEVEVGSSHADKKAQAQAQAVSSSPVEKIVFKATPVHTTHHKKDAAAG